MLKILRILPKSIKQNKTFVGSYEESEREGNIIVLIRKPLHHGKQFKNQKKKIQFLRFTPQIIVGIILYIRMNIFVRQYNKLRVRAL